MRAYPELGSHLGIKCEPIQVPHKSTPKTVIRQPILVSGKNNGIVNDENRAPWVEGNVFAKTREGLISIIVQKSGYI